MVSSNMLSQYGFIQAELLQAEFQAYLYGCGLCIALGQHEAADYGGVGRQSHSLHDLKIGKRLQKNGHRDGGIEVAVENGCEIM